MSGKIGMCCACGGSFPKSQTILHRGFEYCRWCAEMIGVDLGDYDEGEDED